MAARSRLKAVVCGYDHNPQVLDAALELQAIDTATHDIQSAVRGAQVVFVATPIRALAHTIEQALEYAESDCVVSDVGSTKRILTRPGQDERFVGGHPLAGAETAGVTHARADLFDGANWYLTPARDTSGVLYERLHRVIVGLGGQPSAIEPEAHDRLMACVSHLPHVLANLLVAQAARALDLDGHLPATGPSFRDATRVAGANSAIWTDIYLSNADALISGIEETMLKLGEVAEALRRGDAAAITTWNEQARSDRELLLGAGLLGGPVHELRVSVPNRPGVIAEIALELGRAGVNIVDMALSPSADNSQGGLALWLRGEEHANRAQGLISALNFSVARA
jgi:prephenate dehydrogenase